MISDCDFDLITPDGLNCLADVSSILGVENLIRTGPGYWPLKTCIGRSKPSGAIVTFVISKWYCRGQYMQLAIKVLSATRLDNVSSCWPFEIHVGVNIVVVFPAGPRRRPMIATR